MSESASLIDHITGVGPARARALKHLGVNSLRDLVEYFPRDYRFESSELSIDQLRPEEIQTARGELVAVNYTPGRRPRFEGTIDDGTAKLALVWFNASYLRRTLHPGLLIRVQGRVKFFRNMPQMANPKWKLIEVDTERIEKATFRSIYPASTEITSDNIATIVRENLDIALQGIEEWFTPELIKRRGLINRRDAYRLIHTPSDLREATQARRRLVYDELMQMQLALALSKRLRDGRITAPIVRVDKLLDERIRKRFPFQMTNAQRSAAYEMIKDLQSGRPMNRLLQGDVGSGKTAVAVYGMLAAVANRMQAVLLAPTEVLAEQHFLTLSNFLKDSSVTIDLLTSRTKRANRSTIQKKLAEGKTHLAIGTQALLQEDVEFANLGLVVVDEQHKLGVQQRATLRSKGLSPHYLVMTATPIPRTLALSYFADFDLSVINELPPGRMPIETEWYRTSQRDGAYDFVRQQARAGRQAYVVVPQIADDGLEDAKSVIKEFDRLSKGPLHHLKLAMLHGQMATDDKHATMSAFRDGRIDVLVATTVIEVGIDVPNATIIVIEDADRFGLSQLHQLRGRVGRGSEQSHCILISDAPTEDAQERLRAMTHTNDGFEIAEMDLNLRGPGQFFGTRQHGLPEFKMADLSKEMALLEQAKDDALALLKEDPKLDKAEHRALRKTLAQKFGSTLSLAQIG